jgi:hypothetical protein
MSSISSVFLGTRTNLSGNGVNQEFGELNSSLKVGMLRKQVNSSNEPKSPLQIVC